jgi:hypothetical protein
MKRDEQENPDPDELDEIPRKSFWAVMPKRSFTRIFMLLAALAGIIYLRQKTSAIAGCMGEAFTPPARSSAPSAIRARVALPAGDASIP